MKVGSLFTGIGGFDLGLERAGHDIRWQCESNPFRREVLGQHWPDIPCYEDVCNVALSDEQGRPGDLARSGSASDAQHQRRIDGDKSEGVDLVCGGFPCQDLSIAGRKAGLAGERSGLFFEFVRIADAVLPDGGWILIENVPGLLSSNGGRDFAVLLASLAEVGFHDLAWRVLDSRDLGVPQRRRRVFILGRRTTGRSASQVLLEPEGGGGDTAPRIPPKQEATGSPTDGARSARTLQGGGRWDGESEDFIAKPLGAKDPKQGGYRNDLDHDTYVTTHTLTSSPPDADRVREAAGFPRRVDDPPPDGRRYASCGDAITVNVAEWIGRRLDKYERWSVRY